jgi:iron complex outermembrane receptor protein
MRKIRLTKQYLVNNFYLLTFLLTFGVGARAEDSSADELMEEVVVTAMKREQNLMDAPVSVQSFSGDLVEELQLTNTFELADLIPGALAYKPSQPTLGEIFIRGAGASSFQSGGAKGDRTTGVYVDDTPMSYPNQQRLPPVPMFDLERVEVLRGPQGTTYGAGSMGGTIKYITRSPDLQSFGGKVQVTASDTNGAHELNQRIDAVVNIPLIQDRLAVRVMIQDNHLAGYASVQGSPDIKNADDFDQFIYRVKALWQVTDKLSVEATHWSSETEQWMVRNYPTREPVTFRPFPPGHENTRNDSVWENSSVTVNWELPFADLISNTQWLGEDPGFGPDNPNAADHTTPGFLPIGICSGSFGPDEWCVLDLSAGNMVYGMSQEARLVSNGDGPLQWIAGLSYMDMNSDGEEAWDLHGFLNFLDNQGVNLLSTESRAVFGEVSYSFMDGKLIALAGLRFFEDTRVQEEWFTNEFENQETVIEDGVEYLTGGDAVNYSYFYDKKDFDTVNPRFNVSYFPSDEGMVYVNIAKGFRSGTAMGQNDLQLADINIEGIDGAFADGDTVWSYELGSKWVFGRLVAQGAVIFSQWQDLQQQVGIDYVLNGVELTAGSIAYNIGDAGIWGAEWDLQYFATDHLTLGFNGAYTDGEYTSIVDNPVITPKDQHAVGKDVPLIVKWTGTATVAYRVPLMDTGWNLNLIGTAAYRHRPIAETGLPAKDPFRRVNLRASVERGPWSIQLFAENAFDENGIITPGTIGRENGTFLNPRTVGLTLRFAND